jgi:hypothetical protein
VTAETEPSTPSVRPALPGARWALALGGFLLAGFLLIMVRASIDRGQRGALETVLQMTAVEDKAYYSVPADGAERPVAARLGDRALFLISPSIVGLHDAEARRVATDSATGVTVYSTENLKVLSVKEQGNTFLLKVETGKYVKVRPSEAVKEKE